MPMLSEKEQQILGKIRQCSSSQLAEIEDFIDFLHQRSQDRALVTAAAQGAEAAFAQVWDNLEDAAYDDL
ncbi:hypothetical protein [Leptolyngbya sp. PCC 6406]|uniref:hypothetical protein n=1 Tax=Leptolyngbya sp. PCC 6406 TaxID=1173264 RepID=UPI00048A3CE3|nr:hypothetical protein [Leptolyngbya sp. PCC 6406]